MIKLAYKFYRHKDNLFMKMYQEKRNSAQELRNQIYNYYSDKSEDRRNAHERIRVLLEAGVNPASDIHNNIDLNTNSLFYIMLSSTFYHFHQQIILFPPVAARYNVAGEILALMIVKMRDFDVPNLQENLRFLLRHIEDQVRDPMRSVSGTQNRVRLISEMIQECVEGRGLLSSVKIR